MASDRTRQPAAASTFAQLLKHLRSDAHLTQEELAERANVSARLVSDLERGVVQRPRRDTVRLLADGLRLADAERAAFVAAARGRPETNDGDPRRHSLPLPPGPIVGRLKEVAAATALLLPDAAPRPPGRPPGSGASGPRPTAARLLTLTGPGGVGKTRLALEVAFHALDAFADGVYFVDLAPVGDPALVLPTIAQELGVRASGEQPLHDRLVLFLADKRVLLLLDNVEHLTPAAPAIADLLAACPTLAVLATSRVPLHLRIEQEYRVAPLALPDVDRLPPADELARIPAVDLLVQRAEAATRGFALTAGNARAIAEIAVRLDGLPLAIELAAARMKVLAPAALLAHLERRLELLTGGARDLPARQQTLRATLDWSHDLLTEEEQRLFRRLAVFAGGCTLAAAEYVQGDEGGCAGGGGGRGVFSSSPSSPSSPSVIDVLAALVDKNLLRALDSEDGEPRFGMLETIREYGIERLAAAGEEAEARQRHADWCLALAERAEPALTGPEQVAWFTRLEIEHDNLRAALAWAIERQHGELAARLGGALRRFWNVRGYLDEGRRWLEQALALDGDVPPAARAKALLCLGVIAYRQGDYARASALEDALAIYRALGDAAGAAASLCNLGLVAAAKGDYELATAVGEESLTLFRTLGDQNRVANQLENLGLVAYDREDYDRAAELLAEAIAIARAVGNRHGLAFSLNNLARVALARHDCELASALQLEALDLWRVLSAKDGLATCLENLARIAAARNEPERTARLFAAAGALRARIGAPGRLIDRHADERHILAARARLGEAAFAAVWEDGRAMPLEAAIDYALDDGRPVAIGDAPHPSAEA